MRICDGCGTEMAYDVCFVCQFGKKDAALGMIDPPTATNWTHQPIAGDKRWPNQPLTWGSHPDHARAVEYQSLNYSAPEGFLAHAVGNPPSVIVETSSTTKSLLKLLDDFRDLVRKQEERSLEELQKVHGLSKEKAKEVMAVTAEMVRGQLDRFDAMIDDQMRYSTPSFVVGRPLDPSNVSDQELIKMLYDQAADRITVRNLTDNPFLPMQPLSPADNKFLALRSLGDMGPVVKWNGHITTSLELDDMPTVIEGQPCIVEKDGPTFRESMEARGLVVHDGDSPMKPATISEATIRKWGEIAAQMQDDVAGEAVDAIICGYGVGELHKVSAKCVDCGVDQSGKEAWADLRGNECFGVLCDECFGKRYGGESDVPIIVEKQ